MNDLGGIRLGVVRGISYGLFGKPDEFVPQARALGAGLLRVYVYWGQVEPEPGVWNWEAVDALLAQLDGDEEMWITICASSPWATRQPTDFLPPSPPKDAATYARFVDALVRRCDGRVRFWQCENEASNTGLLWAGTAEEYVSHLGVMSEAVRRAAPDAKVVLAGCGYDVFSSADGSEQRGFYRHVAEAGRDRFDLFSVNLYGDPERAGEFIATARAFMSDAGYLKPVVVGEHGGPVLFEFPELESVLGEAFAAAMTDASQTQSVGELVERAAQETPERRAMRVLYARMAELPPRLRMLMDGCPPELEAKRHRINGRQLVIRTVLALAAGVPRTAYWNLAPEVAGYHDPYQMMHLLFGKLPLLDYEGGALDRRHPAAEVFARLAARLDGATSVSPVALAETPDRLMVRAFRALRSGRTPLLIVWDRRDAFDGEDQPPIAAGIPWDGGDEAIDAFGARVDVIVEDGRARVPASATPIFIE